MSPSGPRRVYEASTEGTHHYLRRRGRCPVGENHVVTSGRRFSVDAHPVTPRTVSWPVGGPWELPPASSVGGQVRRRSRDLHPRDSYTRPRPLWSPGCTLRLGPESLSPSVPPPSVGDGKVVPVAADKGGQKEITSVNVPSRITSKRVQKFSSFRLQ